MRDFDQSLPRDLLHTVQEGVFRTVYRGVPFLKSPFDIALYLQLLGRLQPRTVIEIGAKHGGSALWFADMMTVHGVSAPRVVSVDIELIAKFTDPRITFIQGDAADLEQALPASLLDACERPFLVVEDSSHLYKHCLAVLNFFHTRLQAGDYIIVEDGVLSHFADGRYAKLQDGPNRAVKEFLDARPESYELDLSLCDHFGHNVTYNPNGWLRRL